MNETDARPQATSPLIGFTLDSILGQVLDDRYSVDELIGMGAMGAVYRGQHLRLRRTVAIKVPRPELCNRPGFLGRFEREALTMAKLVQENIVQVFDVQISEDPAKPSYIAMEYVEGVELEKFLFSQDSNLTVKAVLDLLSQTARGLDAAHERGIIHRDIKPKNIFVTLPQRVAKIMDFGVAKLEMEDVYETVQESAIGTPAYMAPEQITGDSVTPSADIYAFGMTIYNILARALPFDVQSASNMLFAQVSSQPIPAHMRNPSLPVKVHKALLPALAKSPEDRPKTAKALIRAVHTALESYENRSFSDLFSGDLNAIEAARRNAPEIQATMVDVPIPWLKVTTENKKYFIAAAAAAVVMLVIGLGVAFRGGDESEPMEIAAVVSPEPNRSEPLERPPDVPREPLAASTPVETPEPAPPPIEVASAVPIPNPGQPAGMPEGGLDQPLGAPPNDASEIPSEVAPENPEPDPSSISDPTTPEETFGNEAPMPAQPPEPTPEATMEPTPAPTPKTTPKPAPPKENPSELVVASAPNRSADRTYLEIDAARWDPKFSPTEPVAWRREQIRLSIEDFLEAQIEKPVFRGQFEPETNALSRTGGETAAQLVKKLEELYQEAEPLSLSIRIVEGTKIWSDRAEIKVDLRVMGRPKDHPDPNYRKLLLTFSNPVPVRVQKVGDDWALLSFNNH